MKKACEHPIEKQTLVVIDGFDMWEITQVLCTKCNEFITKPEEN